MSKKMTDINSFCILCGGCNRLFKSEANFEQHFFCPWRGEEKSKKKIRKMHGISPIYQYYDTKIWDPEEFIGKLAKWYPHRSSYKFGYKWKTYKNIYNTFDDILKDNICFFLPENIISSLEEIKYC